jgi:hypothetical protein
MTVIFVEVKTAAQGVTRELARCHGAEPRNHCTI